MPNFYPRPPRGGRRLQLVSGAAQIQFLSTPSARRATSSSGIVSGFPADFYPRPPRGGRPIRPVLDCRPAAFLSTPSARRATLTPRRLRPLTAYFYPRPPRGGRPRERKGISLRRTISIHALREEGDVDGKPTKYYPAIFLSTPSARRATQPDKKERLVVNISIHALREEGDPQHAAAIVNKVYFYPRPPRGGRPFTSTAQV